MTGYLQAQCWICPHCYDDKHHDPEDCRMSTDTIDTKALRKRMRDYGEYASTPLMHSELGTLLDAADRLAALEADLAAERDEVALKSACIEGMAANINKLGARSDALEGENGRMVATLYCIGDYAHNSSTGPAAPDALWEIRSMAYDAIKATGGPA